MEIAMIQDRTVPLEELEAVWLDRGTFFGDGVYEVLRSYDGRLFALDEHLERFARSLAAVEINGVDIGQVRRRVEQAFAASGISNAKIYFHITRGSGPRDHAGAGELEPNFFLTVSELPDDRRAKEEGIAVCTHPDWRWKRCDIKSLNLLANVLARRAAEKKNCAEAILVDEHGLITEGAGSAFFALFGRTLQTAPLSANILSSITRNYVLKAAGEIGLEVEEKSLTPEQAVAGDELLLAVTTRDVVGVVRFDDHTVSDGKPGKYTKMLMEKFRQYTR